MFIAVNVMSRSKRVSFPLMVYKNLALNNASKPSKGSEAAVVVCMRILALNIGLQVAKVTSLCVDH